MFQIIDNHSHMKKVSTESVFKHFFQQFSDGSAAENSLSFGRRLNVKKKIIKNVRATRYKCFQSLTIIQICRKLVQGRCPNISSRSSAMKARGRTTLSFDRRLNMKKIIKNVGAARYKCSKSSTIIQLWRRFVQGQCSNISSSSSAMKARRRTTLSFDRRLNVKKIIKNVGAVRCKCSKSSTIIQLWRKLVSIGSVSKHFFQQFSDGSAAEKYIVFRGCRGCQIQVLRILGDHSYMKKVS